MKKWKNDFGVGKFIDEAKKRSQMKC